MSVTAAFIVPHPPLIVPAVGNGRERGIWRTIDSYREAANRIAGLAPETIVVVSPHATLYADYFHVSPGRSAKGSLKQFGAPHIYSAAYDEAFVERLSLLCEQRGFPAGTLGEKSPALDHGTLIPMHFIDERYSGYQLVRCGISGLSRRDHYVFGQLLGEAAASLGRSVVLIASGDLSHKLTPDGPYGFAPEGPLLDEALVEAMRGGDFGAFLSLDPALCEKGAECGLSGFIVMAGALDRKAVTPEFLSYEGPFGVGYAVCCFLVTGDDPGRDILTAYDARAAARAQKVRSGEDAYVRLARLALESHVRTGSLPAMPDGLPPALTAERAGVFVSIKKDGMLRGCIGTTAPTQSCIAEEIRRNAISSGTQDPRFPPVRESELADLVYSVDVLSAPEPVADESALDARRYGVIVSSGHKRGLLLPNLEGVDSVEEQVRIARRKAGIGDHERYSLARFEVVRHT